jgi:hypothetical protein
MIKYGLKLWTSNEHLFGEALCLFQKGDFDFIELYHNANKGIDLNRLRIIKKIPVMVHNTNDCGFHEFEIGEKQLEIWEKTKKLADFFKSEHVVVHPGTAKNFETFKRNLDKIDDPRIIIENMPGLDIYNQKTFGYDLKELKQIKKIKEICFDFEKAVKSACYQKIDYREFISQCLDKLRPLYFHISGGDLNSRKDEHLNLREANFDLKWIKSNLRDIAKKRDIFLVFEVPKNKGDLENDVDNIDYFREI